jgi:hypothetical protein
VSHGKADPYLPLIELLKNYVQITPPDDERGRREKVTGRVLTLDRHLAWIFHKPSRCMCREVCRYETSRQKELFA